MAIRVRGGEPMKREEAMDLGIADASAEVSSRALIAGNFCFLLSVFCFD